MATEHVIEQSRLEKEGIAARKTTINENEFNSKTEPYSNGHDAAITHNDNKHAHGKGTGSEGHTFTIPDGSKSKTAIDRSQFDTENGGGSYDIYGIDGTGSSTGRKRLQEINLYGPRRAYGKVNTEANLKEGQFSI